MFAAMVLLSALSAVAVLRAACVCVWFVVCVRWFLLRRNNAHTRLCVQQQRARATQRTSRTS
jgi:hypothetical protein